MTKVNFAGQPPGEVISHKKYYLICPRSILIPTILQFRIACSLATLTLTHGALKSLRMICAICSAKRFQQGKMSFAQHGLYMLRDVCVIQRVIDVVADTCAAVGQCDVEIDLQRLRHDLFSLVYADQCGDLEFTQEDDIHF